MTLTGCLYQNNTNRHHPRWMGDESRGSNMMRQPDVRPVQESGNLYRLYTDYGYRVGDLFFRVPEGFRYDGASIPRWAYTLTGLLPDGIHRPAALLHDWMYCHQGSLVSLDGVEIKLNRKQVDRIFKANLKECGLKSWHTFIAYHAVRVGGSTYWKSEYIRMNKESI